LREKKMKNKTRISAIAFVLLLTFGAILATLPTIYAHDPPWQTPTWAYMSVAPKTVGVGQQIIVVMWLNDYPRTAVGAYGDRWDNYYIDITAPDGSQETLGPFTSDPVGSAYTNYTPNQVGEYTFVFRFEGDTLTGEPEPPGGFLWFGGDVFLGDIYLPSTSDPVTLTVQQDPIAEYEETPLPEDYWTRPIYGANRDWYKVAGNWMGGAAQNVGPTTNFGYGTGPESAHVMWAKQYWDGGVMDTRFGDISYYTGLSYETFALVPPIIMNGRLYYNVLTPPRYGWYCVDLRTGEELYFHNTTGPIKGMTNNYPTMSGSDFDFSGILAEGMLTFGQIYDYESPNQHGGLPYLWSNELVGSVYGGTGASTTWQMFDAFTGNYICSIANVSMAGTMVYGKDGSILYYNVDTMNNRLTVWNTSRAIWYKEAYDSNQYWMWRPYLNQTFDGNNGFSLDVSIPSLPGRALAIREGEYIIGGTSGKNNGTSITEGTLWAISLQPGAEGTLLWQYDYVPPETVIPDTVGGGVFGFGLMAGPVVDPEDGVFLFSQSMTRERWGFDLETGEMLWGPTDPGPAWDYYGMSNTIYDGKLFSYGYGGVLIAYDVKTGQELWRWSSGTVGLETFYENVPLSLGCIADGKIYLYSSEHSPSQPLRRDANIWCIDTDTGELLWKIQCWASNLAIADGYIVTVDHFDNRVYCYGKGPSETTISVQDDSVAKGDSIMITGSVTDQSAGAAGTPAIADAYMEDWMEYMYQQRPMPGDAQGVTVKLYAIDPNGNYQDIGEATSDIWGNYGKSWTPPVEGDYMIMAEFEGSASYGGSSDSTYVTVGPAVSAAQPIETEEPAEAFALGTTELAIIAVVIIVIAGVVAFWAIRKRK
jgi:hypothetical protein